MAQYDKLANRRYASLLPAVARVGGWYRLRGPLPSLLHSQLVRGSDARHDHAFEQASELPCDRRQQRHSVGAPHVPHDHDSQRAGLQVMPLQLRQASGDCGAHHSTQPDHFGPVEGWARDVLRGLNQRGQVLAQERLDVAVTDIRRGCGLQRGQDVRLSNGDTMRLHLRRRGGWLGCLDGQGSNTLDFCGRAAASFEDGGNVGAAVLFLGHKGASKGAALVRR